MSMKYEDLVRDFVSNEPSNEDNQLVLAQKQYRRERLLLKSIEALALSLQEVKVQQKMLLEDSMKEDFDMGIME